MNLDEPRNQDNHFSAIMAEYEQLWQSIRTDQQIQGAREALFITISFGILAYSLGQNLTVIDISAAATASIFIFLFHLLTRERIYIHTEMRAERFREIEKEVNDLTCRNSLIHQTSMRKKFSEPESLEALRKGSTSTYGYAFPIVTWISHRININKMNMILLISLILLWAFRIW